MTKGERPPGSDPKNGSAQRRPGETAHDAAAGEPSLDEHGLFDQPGWLSSERAEAALPGTAALEPLLTLHPPDVQPGAPGDGADLRDFGPDPVAEVSLLWEARDAFPTAGMAEALSAGPGDAWGQPTFYVRTPEGRTTFLYSSDCPEDGAALIAGWSLSGHDAPDGILAGAEALGAWLAARPEGFASAPLEPAAVEAQVARAEDIIELEPSEVAILAFLEEDAQRFDGRLVWDTLHRIGLRWGDMDQFHWDDPTDETDHLFSAEVDDGHLGYALPEEIAAGRQDFITVRFALDIARSPAPMHVLGEMVRAAEMFWEVTGCGLAALLDDEPVDGPEELAAGVAEVVEALASLGVTPGSGSV